MQGPQCYFCFRFYISLIRSKVSQNYLSRGDSAVPSCCRLCGGGILPLLYQDNSSLNLVPLWFFCTVAPEPYGSCLLILLIPFNHKGPMLNRCRETRATYASKLGSPLKGNYIRAAQKKRNKWEELWVQKCSINGLIRKNKLQVNKYHFGMCLNNLFLHHPHGGFHLFKIFKWKKSTISSCFYRQLKKQNKEE